MNDIDDDAISSNTQAQVKNPQNFLSATPKAGNRLDDGSNGFAQTPTESFREGRKTQVP